MVYLFFVMRPDSILGRLTIYRVSLGIIKDHFLFGTGPGTFSLVYNVYQATFFQTSSPGIKTQLLADNTSEAFNIFIQILVEFGIIGLLLFAYVIWYIIRWYFKNSYNKMEPISIGIQGSIACVLVASCLSNPFHSSPILVLVFLLCAMLVRLSGKVISEKIVPPANRCIQLIICLFIVPVVYKALILIKAENQWNTAAKLVEFEGFEASRGYYEQALPHLQFSGDFLYNYGAEALIGNEPKLADEMLTRATKYLSSSDLYVLLGQTSSALGDTRRAEKCYITASFITPSHLYPKFLLIKLYESSGETKKMHDWIHRALSMPIKINSPEMQAIISEIRTLKNSYNSFDMKNHSIIE